MLIGPKGFLLFTANRTRGFLVIHFDVVESIGNPNQTVRDVLCTSFLKI